MKTANRWILAGAAVATLAVAWTRLQSPGVPVEVSEALRDTLSVVVQEEGRTRARELFAVAAPVAGRLSRALVEEGDRVEQRAVLATLSPAPLDPRLRAALETQVVSAEARVAQARAELAQARHQSSQALREAERRRPLHEMGAITREAMERFEEAADEAAAREEAAAAALETALAELDHAETRLMDTEVDGESQQSVPIRAPISGTVLRVLEESERVVQAGTPLFEMADPGGLQIVVDVLSEDAVQIAPGNPLVITGWGGSHPLHGTVLHVEPSAFTEVSTLGVEEQRVNVIGALERPPPQLGVGYRVDVAVVTWHGEGILTVPSSALFREEGGWHLFTVEDGRARLRAVEVGRQSPGRAEVTGGLDEGAVVVLYPAEGVDDGERVEPTTR